MRRLHPRCPGQSFQHSFQHPDAYALTNPHPHSHHSAYPQPNSTERPLTLAFYGDNLLKVGDASRANSVGFSIVDVLRSQVNSADQIIVSNHGGRNAEWGYQNLQMYILNDKPDVVTLWWGLNDLDGCPGIFDRATKQIIQYKLAALLNQHLTLP